MGLWGSSCTCKQCQRTHSIYLKALYYSDADQASLDIWDSVAHFNVYTMEEAKLRGGPPIWFPYPHQVFWAAYRSSIDYTPYLDKVGHINDLLGLLKAVIAAYKNDSEEESP